MTSWREGYDDREPHGEMDMKIEDPMERYI